MQSAMAKGLFQLPSLFPKKKIISLDIGGTLAKMAFYIPKDDPAFKEPEYHQKLSKETIPSKAIE
jgi:hypothetical protein